MKYQKKTNRNLRLLGTAVKLMILACFITASIYFLFYSWNNRSYFGGNTASAKNGVLDLSVYDLEQPLYIVDGWTFYPEPLFIDEENAGSIRIDGDNISDDSRAALEEYQYIDVSGSTQQNAGSAFAGEPGSFRMIIENIRDDLQLYLPGHHGRYLAFLNGVPIHMDQSDNLLRNFMVLLQNGNNYDIVLQSDGYIPNAYFRPQLINSDSFINMMNTVSRVVILTIIIGVFSIASVCLLIVLNEKKERGFLFCMLGMSALGILWFACFSTKYVNTVRIIIPNITDNTVIILINITMAASLIMAVFLSANYLLPHHPKVRNIQTK